MFENINITMPDVPIEVVLCGERDKENNKEIER
jgi:hypothetical protein